MIEFLDRSQIFTFEELSGSLRYATVFEIQICAKNFSDWIKTGGTLEMTIFFNRSYKLLQITHNRGCQEITGNCREVIGFLK